MPELPEVEVTRLGLLPHVCQQTIEEVDCRVSQLRYTLPKDLAFLLKSQQIDHIERRAKYLLFQLSKGTLIIHLGMSGTLRLCSPETPLTKHDHIDLILSKNQILRYRDPRRFGSWLWWPQGESSPHVLTHLGPEPLSPQFNLTYLQNCLRKRTTAIKAALMDQRVVVGIGNIYVTEACFAAGIHPQRPANSLCAHELKRLIQASKKILRHAIRQGGTTLRDFAQASGESGYFRIDLQAYGRAKMPCLHCQTALETIRLNQRSTVFCPKCQK